MSNKKLEHKLKNRHLQMLALGGVIGTGLFFGTAKSLHETGPSIIFAYLLGGLVIYIILRALGEMVVYNPDAGAYSEYARQYVGPFAGFVTGWSAWFLYTIVCMSELTAVTIFLDYFIPGLPHYLVCLILLVIFTGTNLLSVKYFGEFEFWFALIKIVTIILMLMLAFYIIFIKHDINPNLSTYKNFNIFFAGGVKGFFASLAIVIFSFGGSEAIGIASGESENPSKNVPKAINGIVFRIVIFYVLTMLAIVLLYPYNALNDKVSPFVDVFTKIGFNKAAAFMNFVAITAALSAFNTCLYASSRLLYNLSQSNLSPNYFNKLSKYGSPYRAVLYTSFIVLITVLINYLMPKEAIMLLIAISIGAILIVWFMILISQIFFRRQIIKENIKLKFQLKFYPYSSYFSLTFLLFVLGMMLFLPDFTISVIMIPVWIFILWIIYLIKKFK